VNKSKKERAAFSYLKRQRQAYPNISPFVHIICCLTNLSKTLFKPYIAAYAAFEIEDRRDAQRDTRNQDAEGD
jgi:hypothetical protein